MFTLTIKNTDSDFLTTEFKNLKSATEAFDNAIANARVAQSKQPSHIQTLDFISVDGLVKGRFEYDVLYFDGSKLKGYN